MQPLVTYCLKHIRYNYFKIHVKTIFLFIWKIAYFKDATNYTMNEQHFDVHLSMLMIDVNVSA